MSRVGRLPLPKKGADLVISTLPGNTPVPLIVYDLSQDSIHDDLTSFAQHSVRVELLDQKTVVNRVYQISQFINYLRAKKLDYEDLTSSSMFAYRDHLLSRVPARNARLAGRSKADTVNVALDAALLWLRWLQDSGRIPERTVGPPPCAVISEMKHRRSAKHGSRAIWENPYRVRGTGRGSFNKLPGFVPDAEIQQEVLAEIHEAPSAYCASRNALMLQVLSQTGLRRASLLSLTVKQFERRNLDAAKHDYIDVTPSEQKFGRKDASRIPLSLAYEICGFIEAERAELIREGSSKNASDLVFLSERTRDGLSPRALTKLFSKLMRNAGAPVGSSVHAWRHKFAQDTFANEIEYRRAMGLPLSDADLLSAVSIELNHRNPESLLPYLHSARARGRRRERR